MRLSYSFCFDGATITENSYGHGRDDENTDRTYLEDLWGLAKAYAGRDGARILEWGSGISTLMFADFIKSNNGSLTTLDDNSPYQQAVVASIENLGQVSAYVAGLIGTRESQSDPGLNYSTLPLGFGDSFDLIYIDGRRRVECSLTAAMIARLETAVVVHDYRRARYQSMLGLFEVIDDGLHFRVMRVKPEIRKVFSNKSEHMRGAFQEVVP